MIEAHAPGKLVVCGEYAVLAGVPAIAVAMPVRAVVRIASAVGESTLAVPEEGCWPFVWERGLPVWRKVPPQGQGQLLEAVVATLAAAGCVIAQPLAIELDTRAFQQVGADGRRQKLGLGSSAALTVALVAALLAEIGGREAAPAGVEAFAQRAHRHFQGGAGSGIDIAAAVHGGVVLIGGAGGSVKSLGWPASLEWLAVWSGESASTPALIACFDAFRTRDPVSFARHLAGLEAIAARVAAAWQRDDAVTVLAGLADYHAALVDLDAAAGIGIVTATHRRLAHLAANAGTVYKTSGAGGGDFGIAFAASPTAIVRFAAACAAGGFLTLPGAADAEGVVIREA